MSRIVHVGPMLGSGHRFCSNIHLACNNNLHSIDNSSSWNAFPRHKPRNGFSVLGGKTDSRATSGCRRQWRSRQSCLDWTGTVWVSSHVREENWNRTVCLSNVRQKTGLELYDVYLTWDQKTGPELYDVYLTRDQKTGPEPYAVYLTRDQKTGVELYVS